MALAALPEELVSRICRFLGYAVYSPPPNLTALLGTSDTVDYEHADFQSLRSTCTVSLQGKIFSKSDARQELYYKTMYDAAIRYGCQLEEYELSLVELSIWTFLYFVQIPTFRDRIRVLYLYSPGGDKVSIEQSDSEAPAPTEEQKYVKKEADHMYVYSSEMIYLLVECFKYLGLSKSLEKLEVHAVKGQDQVLAALLQARFPRPIAIVDIHAQTILDFGNGL
jgi:hypothetical protein